MRVGSIPITWKSISAGMVVHFCNPSTWRHRQNCYKFKASLGYVLSSRAVSTTLWEPVSNEKENFFFCLNIQDLPLIVWSSSLSAVVVTLCYRLSRVYTSLPVTSSSLSLTTLGPEHPSSMRTWTTTRSKQWLSPWPACYFNSAVDVDYGCNILHAFLSLSLKLCVFCTDSVSWNVKGKMQEGVQSRCSRARREG